MPHDTFIAIMGFSGQIIAQMIAVAWAFVVAKRIKHEVIQNRTEVLESQIETKAQIEENTQITKESKVALDETHLIVNGHQDKLVDKIASLEKTILELEKKIRGSR